MTVDLVLVRVKFRVKFVEVCLGDVRFRVTKHNNHLFLRLT
jgi:hypothetical protein